MARKSRAPFDSPRTGSSSISLTTARWYLTRVFETDAEALAWADEKHVARTSQGWNDVDVERPSGRYS